MNEYEDEYDLSEMSDEQKDSLIVKLSADLNTAFIVATGLHNAMVDFSIALEAGDVLGQRAATMRDLCLKMHLMAAVSRISLETDWREAAEAAAFEDIIARFEEED